VEADGKCQFPPIAETNAVARIKNNPTMATTPSLTGASGVGGLASQVSEWRQASGRTYVDVAGQPELDWEGRARYLFRGPYRD
jgi:hypothetical protein